MREEIFDIQKGILMFFVMISHSVGYFLHIHSMTIFSFLIISGYFDDVRKNKNFISIFKKRFLGIMCPYFIFEFITFPFFLHGKSMADINYFIRYIFNGIGPQELLMNFPLWFLPYFFSVMVIYDTIYLFSSKLCDKLKLKNKYLIDAISFLFIIILISFSYVYVVVFNRKKLLFNIDFACMSIIFPFVGKLIKDNKNLIKNKFEVNIKNKMIKNIIFSLFFIFIIVLWWILSIINGHIDLVYRVFGKNLIMLYINAIFGYGSLYGFSIFISKIKYINSLFEFVGKNSMDIMAYHIPATIVIPIINFIFPAFLVSKIYQNQYFYNIFIVSFMVVFSFFMKTIVDSIKFIMLKKREV